MHGSKSNNANVHKHRMKNAPLTTTAMKIANFILLEIVCRSALVLWLTKSHFLPLSFSHFLSLSHCFADKMSGIYSCEWCERLTYKDSKDKVLDVVYEIRQIYLRVLQKTSAV